MYKFLYLLISLLLSTGYSQGLFKSGKYDELCLAYDSINGIITGFYENYTGYDDATQIAKFSCVFYLEGVLEGGRDDFKIKTYYPQSSSSDLVLGSMSIVSNDQVTIRLAEEHGGCWNVIHFAAGDVPFKLAEEHNWVQIRFVNVAKAYFFTSSTGGQMLKSYVIAKDILFVERIENDMAFVSFIGKKVTKGWVKLSDLNPLKD